jgi:hypothetical protein
MSYKNLIIGQKMYDFYLEHYRVVEKYPKSEKFTLQTETKATMLRMLRLITRAAKAGQKKPLLIELDTELEALRLLLRLAHDLRYLSNRRYALSSQQLSEIGKLLGGWMRGH